LLVSEHGHSFADRDKKCFFYQQILFFQIFMNGLKNFTIKFTDHTVIGADDDLQMFFRSTRFRNGRQTFLTNQGMKGITQVSAVASQRYIRLLILQNTGR
jgi:hypothetical protein